MRNDIYSLEDIISKLEPLQQDEAIDFNFLKAFLSLAYEIKQFKAELHDDN